MVYIAFISGVSRNWSTSNFLKNEHFLPPDTHTYVEGESKKYSLFWKFGIFCFFEASVLRFALLPYYWRFIDLEIKKRSENDPRYQPFNIPVSMLLSKSIIWSIIVALWFVCNKGWFIYYWYEIMKKGRILFSN